MKTFIEVEAFGDSGTYTECVMVHTEKLDVNEVLNEFYVVQGIASNKELDYRILNEVTTDFIAFLELKGFYKLNTHKVIFSD